MEESQGILVDSLKAFGLSVPPEVASIRDLNTDALFSISAQSLRRLRRHFSDEPIFQMRPFPFPDSLPDSLPERVRICTDAATALRNLGYVGDMSFHKLLYPSEEDLYRLVRFFVGKLSEISEAGSSSYHTDTLAGDINLEQTSESTSKGRPVKIDPNYVNARAVFQESTKGSDVLRSTQNNGSPFPSLISVEVDLAQEKVDREEAIFDDGKLQCLELQHLDEEDHDVLKEAKRMAMDDQNHVGFYIHQLNEQIKARKNHLKELQNQRDDSTNRLEEQKQNLLESLSVNNPDAQVKLQKLKGIDIEMKSLIPEIRKRAEECAKFSLDLNKRQPKVASRTSFIYRIAEITKNRRKQDKDIESILRETRELQLESNAIMERLLRTSAVVDEMMLREAKQDSTARQAYRLLMNIHESFEQMRQKVLETDRTRREVSDIEAKLALMASRNLDVEKLKADLDAIRRENDYLEHQLQNT